MDNNGWHYHDSCGSVSWQILEKDEDTWKPIRDKPMRGEKEEDMKGRRLNIAYHANWL